jgi:hypothetical protein
MTTVLLVGCGSGGGSSHPENLAQASASAHPQAIEPVAGQAGSGASKSGSPGSLATIPLHPKVTGPATNTTAPAKNAPSDAEVRAEIASFKKAVTTYGLNKLNLTGDLLTAGQLPPGPYQVAIASVETAYGHAVACGGIERVNELGVANKTLPCGTEVVFIYHGRAVRCPVIDRGPYIPGRMWDLSGAAAEALHFPGLGPVYWTLG